MTPSQMNQKRSHPPVSIQRAVEPPRKPVGSPWSSSARGALSESGPTSASGGRPTEETDWEAVRVFAYNCWKLETGNKSMSQFASLLVRMVHHRPGVVGQHSRSLVENATSIQGTASKWRDVLPLPVPDDVMETVPAMVDSRETKVKKTGVSGGAVRNIYRELGVDALVYCMIMGLSCLWGGLRSGTRQPPRWKDATPGHQMAVERL